MDWAVIAAACFAAACCMTAACVASGEVWQDRNTIWTRLSYSAAIAGCMGAVFGCLFGILECLDRIIR